MMELNILINDCKKNKEEAREQLYLLFSERLFSLCLKYSSSPLDMSNCESKVTMIAKGLGALFCENVTNIS